MTEKAVVVAGSSMSRSLIALSAIGALAVPGMPMVTYPLHRGEDVPQLGWKPPRSRTRLPKAARRDPSRLQLHAWATPPSDAPDGYFWHQSHGGAHYLLKTPPGKRVEVYDEANDRTIVHSGWGYVKPTYRHGK